MLRFKYEKEAEKRAIVIEPTAKLTIQYKYMQKNYSQIEKMNDKTNSVLADIDKDVDLSPKQKRAFIKMLSRFIRCANWTVFDCCFNTKRESNSSERIFRDILANEKSLKFWCVTSHIDFESFVTIFKLFHWLVNVCTRLSLSFSPNQQAHSICKESKLLTVSLSRFIFQSAR